METDCATCTANLLTQRTAGSRSSLRSMGVAVLGGLLLAVGLVALFLPAPGVLIIAAGLSLLSTRFPVARRWTHSLHVAAGKLRSLRRQRQLGAK